MSRYKQEQKDMAYAIYMTDTLYYRNQNKAITARFYDWIYKSNVPEKDGDEILNDIMNRAGLRFKDE